MTIGFLRQLPLFAELEGVDIEWLLEQAETVPIPAGQVLMREGEEGGSLSIVLDGEFEITKRSGAQEVFVTRRGAGEVMGELSLLESRPRAATVRALCDSRVLTFREDAFMRLLSRQPRATLAILHTVTSRLRQTEAMVRQNEKMVALATLSAGLAHELNNPAAAARRSADLLREKLTEWESHHAELDALPLDETLRAHVNALHARAARHGAAQTSLDPLTRSDRESEVQAWLEDRGVADPWELGPALVSVGWDVQSLNELGQTVGEAHAPTVLRWLGTTSSLYALLDEVRTSTERISEIVKAVKAYVFLDQAPVQEVDVHDCLDNTLVILRHKLRPGVKVVRRYAPDAPPIEAYASELNEVWSNIIENAVEAMAGDGELTIRTERGEGGIVVEISDTGRGIPAEVQSRIFEPFFTTKPPGMGTGLGLHICFNTVQKHHGQITVRSRPGETVFRVALPERLARSASEPATGP